MNYKKIELPMDAVPNYNLADVFTLITASGYIIENGYVSASEPMTEDDYRILWTQFVIRGVPILRTLAGDKDPTVLSGSATVMISAVESVYPDLYYVEDVILGDFTIGGEGTGYTSFVISDILHTIVKSFLTIVPAKPAEAVEVTETSSVN